MAKLNIGDTAPAFSLPNQDNKTKTLADYKGSKLLIAIYVRDGSKGCVMDLQNIQKIYPQLKKSGYQVLGVAVNSIESHQRFKEKLGLSFDLLSDPDMKLIKAYGAYGAKGKKDGETKYGVIRHQFFIDEKGIITGIIDKVDAKTADEQILQVINT